MSALLLTGDCIAMMKSLPEQCVQTCVTSPPYFGLRDYGHDEQIGLEPTPDEYVNRLVDVFRGVRRVLRDDGTLWLNLGDSYAGSWGNAGHRKQIDGGESVQRERDSKYLHRKGFDNHRKPPPASNPKSVGLKQKDLIGIPWRVAFALQADGWYLRQDIIWAKPNPMPESVRDRCTKSHEFLFLLSKRPRYHYDHEAIKEPSVTQDNRRPYTSKGAKDLDGRKDWKSGEKRDGEDFTTRNRRDVWTVATKPYKAAHFATFPPKLIEPCILAGARPGDTVLDPFSGSATTGEVALQHDRRYIGIELNEDYQQLARERLSL